MSRADRNFWLVENKAPIWDTVKGLAHATLAVLKGRHQGRDHARIEAVGEMLENYEHMVLNLMPATLTYRPDMPEAELRAWAADVAKVLGE